MAILIKITEFKKNLNKYLYLSLTQDIFITKYGKVISKLTSPYQDKINIAKSLFGVISDSISLENSINERIESI